MATFELLAQPIEPVTTLFKILGVQSHHVGLSAVAGGLRLLLRFP